MLAFFFFLELWIRKLVELCNGNYSQSSENACCKLVQGVWGSVYPSQQPDWAISSAWQELKSKDIMESSSVISEFH